jgi:glycosyltransferase involved in cell wall biosynthesis
MFQKILSIITVTKNCVATLGNTFDTVRAVKNVNLEYIVIDGASTDGTVNLIKNSDKLVDKFISEPDFGIYNAMNKGLDLATGKYILFINGDDELLPSKFLNIWPTLVAGKYEVVSAESQVVEHLNYYPNLVAEPWKLPFYNSIPHLSTFVLTNLLKKYRFREDLRIAADYDLFLRLHLDGKRFFRVDFPIAIHRRGGASGNSTLSIQEMNFIRRERLGLVRYYISNWIWGLYRQSKSFVKAIGR